MKRTTRAKVYAGGIFFLALSFGTMETLYFGSHWMPSCVEEVFADGLASCMMIAGLVVLALGERER